MTELDKTEYSNRISTMVELCEEKDTDPEGKALLQSQKPLTDYAKAIGAEPL